MRLRARDRAERWLDALWEGRAPRALALLTLPLGLLSLFTRVFASWRRRRPRRRPPLSVVSVGNLRVGGTGKTQVVLELCRRAEIAGLAPAVVIRGYGGQDRGPARVSEPDAVRFGDEAALLACRLRRTTIVVARDRWAGVEVARSLGCNWIVLDDGMQQRAVEPTREVVVVPAESPWGNGRLLPLGPLREPRSRLDGRALLWLHGEGEPAGLAAAIRSRSRAVGFVPAGDLASEPRWPAAPDGRPVAAFAGIARPERFFRALESLGLALAARWPLADHRTFSAQDLAEAAERGRAVGAACLVCTEKDAVRLPRGLVAGLPILALRVELAIERGEAAIAGLLS
ncbi:MAG: tetraacyldisaccharide 4'-kinase [Myxococcales bacterium]